MMKFITRIFAVLVAVAVFAALATLTAQIRPESGGGWAVLFGFIALTLLAPMLTYRVLTRGVRIGRNGYANEGEGAGQLIGAGLERGRRSDDIDDVGGWD